MGIAFFYPASMVNLAFEKSMGRGGIEIGKLCDRFGVARWQRGCTGAPA